MILLKEFLLQNPYKPKFLIELMTFTKKGDFVEIKYSGFHDGKVFDSNISEDLKKINPEAKPEKTIVAIGEGMVVPGLDKALENKEVGKKFEVHVLYKEGFGERKRDLVKTIPLHVFTAQKINPQPGATFFMDNMLVRIITISGARVVTDFNNPLSGKDLDYEFTIVRKVEDDKEKVETLFDYYLKSVPKFEIKDNDIIVRGEEKLQHFTDTYKDKFKELLGKDIKFELEGEKKDDLSSSQEKGQQSEKTHNNGPEKEKEEEVKEEVSQTQK